MDIVSSTFSKRIEVLGNQRDLELLFESLKFIRSRDIEIHDYLIAKVKQIIILDDEASAESSYRAPYGVQIDPGKIMLFIHSREIRTSKYWGAAYVIFQTALINYIERKDSKALRSERHFMDLCFEAELVREAMLTGVDFLERVEAPGPEIDNLRSMARMFEPMIIVPSIPLLDGCPLPDFIEPFEGLSIKSVSTFSLALRSSATDQERAIRYGLSPDWANHVMLFPAVRASENSIQVLQIGLLARIAEFSPALDGQLNSGWAKFGPEVQRCKLVKLIESDGHQIAIVQPIEDPESGASDNEQLRPTIKERVLELRSIILDNEKAPHELHVAAKSPLPNGHYRLICHAIRLLQFSRDGRLCALMAKQLDWLDRTTLASLERALPRVRLGEYPAQYRLEGIELYSQRFQEWIERLGPIAYHRQRKFIALVGEASWNVDLGSLSINFEDRFIFKTQVMGSLAHSRKEWLWSWANNKSGLSNESLTTAKQLKELGREWKIPELLSPSMQFGDLSLDPNDRGLCDGLALLCSALAGADAYFAADQGENLVYLLLFDPEHTQLASSHLGSLANEICLYLPEALMRLRLPATRSVIDHYIKYFSDSIHYSTDGNICTAMLPDNSCLEILYNSRSMLAGIKSVATQNIQ